MRGWPMIQSDTLGKNKVKNNNTGPTTARSMKIQKILHPKCLTSSNKNLLVTYFANDKKEISA